MTNLPARPAPVPAEFEEEFERMGPQMYAVYSSLYTLVSNKRADDILTAHKIGTQMTYVMKRFRKSAVRLISHLLCLDPDYVRDTMFLVKRYPNEADLRQLVEEASRNNRLITWSHVRLLLSVERTAEKEKQALAETKPAAVPDCDLLPDDARDTEQLVEELTEKLVGEGMTVREMRDEIRRRVGRRRKPGAGRPPKEKLTAVAGTLLGCLEQSQIMADKWIRHGIAVFGNESREGSLARDLREADADLAAEALRRLSVLQTAYQTMAVQAERQAERCAEFVKSLQDGAAANDSELVSHSTPR